MAARPCAGLALPCGGLHDADAFGRTGPSRLPVRGPCVSVRRSCDADAFGRTGPTRARPQVWRGSSRRVLACFTAARRARVAHVPRVSRTSGTVTRCHGRRLLAKGVVLRAAMSEGGAKKKAGTICAETAATNGPRWWSPALCLLSRAYRPGFRPPPVDERQRRRQTGCRLADVPRACRRTLPFPLPHNMTFENGKV